MSHAENLAAVVPELIVCATGLVLMGLDALRPRSRAFPWVGLAGTVAGLLALPLFNAQRVVFAGLLAVDDLALFFKLLVLAAVALVALLSVGHRPLLGVHEGEYHTLLVFLAAALMFLAGAANLLMISLALEMVSLSSYLLTGHLKGDARSSEAALKYFLFGALCSGLFLYGATLLYGLTGTLDLMAMAPRLEGPRLPAAAWAALLLILVGLGFKMAMAPFHLWCPDAYEGAPTPITALLSVASKAGGFAVAVRFLITAFPPAVVRWEPLLWLLSALTMTVGNVVAVRQTNIKRLLAYSSIAQAGYVLMGLVVMRTSPWGVQAALIYLLAYLFMNLGAFAVVVVVSNALGSDAIEDYAGLARRSPLSAACLLIFLLSLAGIPPLAGFVGKFVLFAAVIDARFYGLAVIAVINSVVAAFYYFRVVRAMYLEPARAEGPLAVATPLGVALGVTLAGTLLIGLWPLPFLSLAQALPLPL